MMDIQRTDIQAHIQEFTGLRKWAVVGASKDPTKYGYKVFHVLKRAGYEVYPVNPKGGTMDDGTVIYPTLAALPIKPDVVSLVVPPKVTEQIMQEAHALGLTRIWMQPGAESEAAIQYGHAHHMKVVHNACAMVYRRSWL